MAFGVLGLFIAAMVDPIWFADRMAGLSLVPEPLWWLMGAIVSFGGAGSVEHFSEVLETGVDAVLAAGVFHRGEIGIGEAKKAMRQSGAEVR